MTRRPHKDHSRSPLDAHRNAVALQLFLTLPPGSAVLFPTVFTEAVAGQPKDHRALAIWVKNPEEDRHRISIRPYVRTHATLIRQDGVPVGVILTKLGD